MSRHRPSDPGRASRRSAPLAPPLRAPRWEALAALVPARCPFHGTGCGIRGVLMVAGGDDRSPVVDVTYDCARTITIPAGTAS